MRTLRTIAIRKRLLERGISGYVRIGMYELHTNTTFGMLC